MGLKERLASMPKQREVSAKIFANSVLKDKDGNVVDMPSLSSTYLLYSKESDKRIGWVKTPSSMGGAGVGWCNLPAYLRMKDVPDSMPYGLTQDDFDEVPMQEYGFPEEGTARELPDVDAPEMEDDSWGEYQ